MKEIHNKNNVPWLKARDGLISTVVSLGFPAELGEVAARHLGSPKAIERMKAYLNYTKPTDMNIIVDEMLAIRDEIDAWKEKKAGIESNQSYNELIYYGLEKENGTDGD